MFELTVRSHFDSAHFLRNYQGKCANIHGHCWQIEATVYGENLDELGMVVDFSVIKAQLKQITEDLDHKLLNDLPEFADGQANPTAEQLSIYIYNRLKQGLSAYAITMGRVRVWESPNAAVTYREG